MVKNEDVFRGFGEGVCCAMAVFGELAPQIGLDEKTAKKIASCFGSGMGQASTCGCVTGTLMALGYKYGNDAPGQFAQRDLLFKKRQVFLQRFIQLHGSIVCKDLLQGLHPMVPEDRALIDEQGLMRTICAPMVCETCEFVHKLLDEPM